MAPSGDDSQAFATWEDGVPALPRGMSTDLYAFTGTLWKVELTVSNV